MFQIVRLVLDGDGEVTARRPLQPLFELRDDAMAMAEFDASRLWGDYGCDEERDGWWATDTRGQRYRFVVEQVDTASIAAWLIVHGLPSTWLWMRHAASTTSRGPARKLVRQPVSVWLFVKPLTTTVRSRPPGIAAGEQCFAPSYSSVA